MPYLGSGWLVGSSCYVFVNRHQINKADLVDGEIVYHEGASPIGYKVSLKLGPDTSGRIEPYTGRIIMAGPSIEDANDDFALIRLEKRSSAAPLINNANLKNYPNGTISF